MNSNEFTITAYSTALFSTWIFVEELGLLFDAGDGVVSSLMQKSRKVKNVFITHADRDHLTGLLQFNQLNSRPGFPKIHYPADCGSFLFLKEFCSKFDPHTTSAEWYGIKDADTIEIKKGVFVDSVRNNHVPAPLEQHKSLSYIIREQKQKLKPEFSKLKGKEIAEMVRQKGRSFISNTIDTKLIGISGDTPVEKYDHWNNTKTLIHESTFLEAETGLNSKKNKHSTLDEVLCMVSEIKIEQLILKHFSSRYSEEEIRMTVQKKCKCYNITVPVYCIMPGKISFNILGSVAVNA